MPIVQQGSINTTALVVPDLYVQIVPPQNLVLNGVPTNVVGVVGTASWGPVGHPVIVATMADYAQSFGPVMARKYDMGTQVATAVQQGAQNFRCVRVTDNTDSAAQAILPATTVTFTALHTGSLGNQVMLTLSTGSKANTWRLTVSLPGLQPEVYDNIAGTGALFWSALASAVNQGQGPQRGPSQFIIASAGGATIAPSAFSIALGSTTAGSDGAANVAATGLVGVDIPPRSGMYALRGQGCGIAMLADADDPELLDDAGRVRARGRHLHDPHRAGRRHDPECRHRQAAGRARQLRREADVRRLAVVVGSGQRHHPSGIAAGLCRRTPGQPLTRAVQPEQAALQRHRQPEVRHAGLRSERLLLVRGSGGAAGCGHRCHQQSAAGRQLLGRARRAQLLIQCSSQRRQLHPPDQLHRSDTRCWNGPICRSGDHRRPVPPHTRDAIVVPAEHARTGPARQHRRQPAVQRDLRHVQQSLQPDQSRLRSIGRAGAIPGDQREVHHQSWRAARPCRCPVRLCPVARRRKERTECL